MTKKNADFNNVLVRFYDSGLIDKLSAAFRHGNYESKNAFLTELIEQGLTTQEHVMQKRTELDIAGAKLDERLINLENQSESFAYTIYQQFKALLQENEINRKVLCAIYNLLEAWHFGESITPKELDSGFYDKLPSRFWSYA